MSEEKKLPQATVTVEYDGETQVYRGHAFALSVVGDDATDGRSEGYVNIGDAIDLMGCLGRHIGRAASCSGLPEGVADAVAVDAIKKQMKKDSFSDLLTHLDAALEKCGECQESEQEES